MHVSSAEDWKRLPMPYLMKEESFYEKAFEKIKVIKRESVSMLKLIITEELLTNESKEEDYKAFIYHFLVMT